MQDDVVRREISEYGFESGDSRVREVVASLIWAIGDPSTTGSRLRRSAVIDALGGGQREEMIRFLFNCRVLRDARSTYQWTPDGAQVFELSLSNYQVLCGALGLDREERLAKMIAACVRAVDLGKSLSDLVAQDKRRTFKVVGSSSGANSNTTDDLANKIEAVRNQLESVLSDIEAMRREHDQEVETTNLRAALAQLNDGRGRLSLVHDVE